MFRLRLLDWRLRPSPANAGIKMVSRPTDKEWNKMNEISGFTALSYSENSMVCLGFLEARHAEIK